MTISRKSYRHLKIGTGDKVMPQSYVAARSISTVVDSYSLPSESLASSPESRLDAAHYNPELLHAIRVLRDSGMKVARLGEITGDVFIPPRFKRIYVDDPAHGVPFLQGSHIVQFRLADLKFLSSSLHQLEKWIIRRGWILVTCSGTIGRAAICPEEWDGWAASQHILRIVPNEKACPPGYLCSFLSSPLGQVQLTANIYGAVVDELTEKQAEGIFVPLPNSDEDVALIRSLNATMSESVVKRSEAAALVNEAIDGVRPSSRMLRESSGFSLSARHLDDNQMRFDAGNFNPSLLRVLDLLGDTKTDRLGNIADVFMPPRFNRVYVEPEHGVPFLQGSHVIHFQPAGLKHLSREYDAMDDLLVRAGWLLVTRSGTVGRVTMCPDEWDGWAATEDIIRVIPYKQRCPSGYLCSFLSSPFGQVQLTSQMHGAVVDHLTEDQVRNVLVPLPDAQIIRELDSKMKKGMSIKSKAVKLVGESVERVSARFGQTVKQVDYGGAETEQATKVVPIPRQA